MNHLQSPFLAHDRIDRLMAEAQVNRLEAVASGRVVDGLPVLKSVKSVNPASAGRSHGVLRRIGAGVRMLAALPRHSRSATR
jgi:hypothetical protein